jgi:nucleoside-triphosphatase THEP1
MSLQQSFRAPRKPRAAKAALLLKEDTEPLKPTLLLKEEAEPLKPTLLLKEEAEPLKPTLLLKETKAPKAPKAARTPRAPRTPKAAKTPKVPRTAKAAKATKLLKEQATINDITTNVPETERELTADDKDFISSLCGNHNIYSDILVWLRTFNYDTKISVKSCVIVAGATSIGKTYSINKIANHLNYEIIGIDNNNCYNSQFLKDIIQKSTSSSFIQILTNNFQKKVVIIDNFDSLFIADKTINITLLKILLENKLKNIPIICISNNDIIKKIGDIKKLCALYLMTTPNNEDITGLLLRKSDATDNISKCCLNSNGNLNKLFRDIDNINNDRLYSDSVENTSDINILYGNEFNRQLTKRIIAKDPWMIPLKFHENLISNLNNRILPLNKYNEYYKGFMNIMCLYDYYMFKDNIEFCVELFASKVYYLSVFKYKKNATVKSNIGNFTKMLSYLSLQKKNIKNNYNNIKSLPLYQLSNYHISLCNRKFISFN